MTDLRRYDPAGILAAANETRDRLDGGKLNALEFALALNDLRFRDEKGDYWFLDARTNRWYRFDQEQWQPASTEPNRLEGPTSLAFASSTSPGETEAAVQPPFEKEEPQSWTETRALEVVVQTIGLDYKKGRLSSRDVEEFLAGKYLVDEKGRVWAVGVRSHQWHYFENGRWATSEGPPGLDSLLRPAGVQEGVVCPQCGATVAAPPSDARSTALVALLGLFLSRANPLPEQMADPWDPPAGFPKSLTAPGPRCESCGSVNPTGSRFCNRCGAALGCPVCGATNPPGSRFCAQCGAPLGG